MVHEVEHISLNQCTPLQRAVILKRTDHVVALLKVPGCLVDARNVCGDTALMYACQAGELELAKLLLESGADPNLTPSSGEWEGLTVMAIIEKDYCGSPHTKEHLLELLTTYGASTTPSEADMGATTHQPHALM